ncbi:MAG: diaminopimelate epimerase [Candidatus Omnitrophica bacterium]|jgi:diaminopimelate epimerase|nr:diaminopimelate epimerase [Candidatus Omnitrophota bacterium]
MRKINFTKMVAAGNDFVVIKDKISGNLPLLARRMCDRKFGIGADGLLLLSKCKNADFRMRIFNADGSEAEMCGNGARCAALFSAKKENKMLTLAGIVDAEVSGSRVKIRITSPKCVRLDIPLMVNGRKIKVNFINTGVPHAVIFVSGLEDISVGQIGRLIRFHREFAPAGTNVNFVETGKNNLIRVRTYERGVEGETLACGTGSTASALIFALKNNSDNLVKVFTQSGEILKVYFQNIHGLLKNVWLEGGAKIVYKGEYYV